MDEKQAEDDNMDVVNFGYDDLDEEDQDEKEEDVTDDNSTVFLQGTNAILDLQALLDLFGRSFCCRHWKEPVSVGSLEAVTKGVATLLNFLLPVVQTRGHSLCRMLHKACDVEAHLVCVAYRRTKGHRC